MKESKEYLEYIQLSIIIIMELLINKFDSKY